MKKSLVIFKENVSHHKRYLLAKMMETKIDVYITMMLENIFFFFARKYIYEINTMNISVTLRFLVG